MASVTLSHIIDAPVEDVWASWDDFGGIYKFNPNLKRSYLLEGSAATGVGARRQCDFKDGKNYIRERIVAYVPNREMTIDVYDGSMPLKSAQLTISFNRLGPARSEVVMVMVFELKMGLFGRLMVPMMKPQFRKMLNSVLEANGRFVMRQELATAA